MKTTTIKIDDLHVTFPDNDTCIGKKLKTGEMWEGKAIREQLIPNFKDGTTFLDCGAFIGTHTMCMAKAKPDCDVYAFEMMPEIYELLSENVKQNNLDNVKLHNCPLSNNQRFVPLPDRDYDTPDNYGYTRIDRPGTTHKVLTKCVDDFVFKKPVSVIKIDVEGHEMQVLRGAMRTIEQHRPFMMVEVWEKNLVSFQYSSIWKRLRALGYTYKQYYENLLFIPGQNEINTHALTRDTVFYLGLGKTGSASIFHGLSNATHYHSAEYFNWVTGAHLESDLDLLKVISGIGYMLGFRPRVIECLRDPHDRAVSALFHNWYNAGKRPDALLQKSDAELLEMLEEYKCEKPISDTLCIPENIQYIVLHLEQKDKWEQQLAEYGIKWTPTDSNINQNQHYQELRSRLQAAVSAE